MNKIITYAVLALAAVALAHGAFVPKDQDVETQAFFPEPEDERQLCSGDLEVYGQFCVNIRDQILADLKRRASEQSSAAFRYFFDTAMGLIKVGVQDNEKIVEKIAEQLKEPDTEVVGDDKVAELQRDIQNTQVPVSFFTAVRGTMVTTVSDVLEKAKAKLAVARQYVNPQNLLDIPAQACGVAKELELYAVQQLRQFQQDLPEGVRRVALDQLPCITTGRLVRINGICELTKSSARHFFKATGLRPLGLTQEVAEEQYD